MSFTNADLLALKNELTTDPKGLTLTTNPADDEANANKLNTVSAATSVDREMVPVSEVAKAIKATEFVGLGVAQRDWLNLVLSTGTVNPKAGGEIRTGILQLFGSSTTTFANLQGLLTEPASRITQMWKLGLLSNGSPVTPSDIANARQAS